MGGTGSGGRRVGSGKKRTSDLEHAIAGTTLKLAHVLTHPNAPTAVAPIETFDPPKTLKGIARQVWLELAPHAFEARTLTRATELGFVILCRNVALERRLAGKTTTAGRSNHRGMIQRVDAELSKFCLSPFGKPLYSAEPATVNPLDKYTQKKA